VRRGGGGRRAGRWRRPSASLRHGASPRSREAELAVSSWLDHDVCFWSTLTLLGRHLFEVCRLRVLFLSIFLPRGCSLRTVIRHACAGLKMRFMTYEVF